MSRFLHQISPALVLASSVALTACGGGGGGGSNNGASNTAPTKVERYALVTALNSGTVSSYAVEANSGLMRLVDKDYLTVPVSVAAIPGSDEFLALSGDGVLNQYTLTSKGKLNNITALSFASSDSRDLVMHPSGQYAYVADFGDGVYQFKFDENGDVIAMMPDLVTPYPSTRLTDMVISNDGHYLYAADNIEDWIVHFSVGEDGALTYVGTVPTGDGPYQLAMHPSKKVLYASNRHDGSLSQYRILEDGSLQELAPAMAVSNTLEGITIDNSGQYLYLSDLGEDRVWQFRITTDGTVEALNPAFISVSSAVTPREMVASPVSNRVYLVDGDSAGMLGFTVTANGTLAAMTPDRVALDKRPTDMVFSTGNPLKAHTSAAYVVNGSSNSISQFTMDDNGAMAPLGDSNPSTDNYPTAIATHPSGKYVYVLNSNSDTLSQFRRVVVGFGLSEKDELKSIQAPFATDVGPAALAVHPSGNYLYVVSKVNQSIRTYSLLANGGIDAEIDSDLFGYSSPSAIGIDPAGRYLWVSNDQAIGKIVTFQIDSYDGTLTKDVARNAGSHPQTINVSADGSTLYISAAGDNNIRRYTVESTGIPTLLDAVLADQYPSGLVLAPNGNALYAANTLSSNISQFSVASDGALSAMNPASVITGTAPQGIAMDYTSKNLLVSNQADGSVTRFRASANGTLSVQETIAVGLSPQGIAIVGYTE